MLLFFLLPKVALGFFLVVKGGFERRSTPPSFGVGLPAHLRESKEVGNEPLGKNSGKLGPVFWSSTSLPFWYSVLTHSRLDDAHFRRRSHPPQQDGVGDHPLRGGRAFGAAPAAAERGLALLPRLFDEEMSEGLAILGHQSDQTAVNQAEKRERTKNMSTCIRAWLCLFQF